MLSIRCHQHRNAITADARARVNVFETPASFWFHTTMKPYGNQRPTGAPPS